MHRKLFGQTFANFTIYVILFDLMLCHEFKNSTKIDEKYNDLWQTAKKKKIPAENDGEREKKETNFKFSVFLILQWNDVNFRTNEKKKTSK